MHIFNKGLFDLQYVKNVNRSIVKKQRIFLSDKTYEQIFKFTSNQRNTN